MTRPSHFLLVLLAAASVVLWLTGEFERLLRPAPQLATDAPVVVRRSGVPPRRDASHDVLIGRVIDSRGWPTTGARLFGPTGSVAETLTDGSFELPTRRVGIQDVRVTADGACARIVSMTPGEPAVVMLVEALPWEDSQANAQPIRRRGLLAGEGFLQDDSGAPIPHGVVIVCETMVKARSDRFGRYRIALPDGLATLLAFDNGHRIAWVELPAGVRKQGLRPLPDLTLMPGLSVRGYLRGPGGDPIGAAPIAVRGTGVDRQALTDPTGAFAIHGLIAGDYVIEPLPFRGAYAPRRRVTLHAHDADVADIAMRTSAPRRIKVVDPQAAPVPRIHVVALEDDSHRRAHGITDEAGRVELEGLGDGDLLFEVRAPESWAERSVDHYDADHAVLVVAQ